MGFKSKKKVGIIGLGIIGSRVTANLRKQEFRVYVWNRTPKPEPNFLGSIAEIAENCEIIQVFVSNDTAIREIVAQLVPVLKPKHTVLCHATVMPGTVREAARKIRETGASFLDAPFTGSKDAAHNAQLVYYIGGDSPVIDKVTPVLKASSKAIIRLGGIGDASVIKIATNMITAATNQALAEALSIVCASGVDPAKFAEALETNASRSGVTDLKLPKMLDGDFTPHFSAKHMLKDMNLALELADQAGLHLEGTSLAASSLLNEVTQGNGDLDFSVIAQSMLPENFHHSKSPAPVDDPARSEETPTDQTLKSDSSIDSPPATPLATKDTAEDDAQKISASENNEESTQSAETEPSADAESDEADSEVPEEIKFAPPHSPPVTGAKTNTLKPRLNIHREDEDKNVPIHLPDPPAPENGKPESADQSPELPPVESEAPSHASIPDEQTQPDLTENEESRHAGSVTTDEQTQPDEIADAPEKSAQGIPLSSISDDEQQREDEAKPANEPAKKKGVRSIFARPGIFRPGKKD